MRGLTNAGSGTGVLDKRAEHRYGNELPANGTGAIPPLVTVVEPIVDSERVLHKVCGLLPSP